MFDAGDGDIYAAERAASREADDAGVRAREIAAMSIRLRAMASGDFAQSAGVVAASTRLLNALRGAVADYSKHMQYVGR